MTRQRAEPRTPLLLLLAGSGERSRPSKPHGGATWVICAAVSVGGRGSIMRIGFSVLLLYSLVISVASFTSSTSAIRRTSVTRAGSCALLAKKKSKKRASGKKGGTKKVDNKDSSGNPTASAGKGHDLANRILARASAGSVEVPVELLPIESNMAESTADHERECAAGLVQWPTIAASDVALPVATRPYYVHSDSLCSVGNAPHGSRALAHVTNGPLLTVDDCAAIIAEAETLGNATGWGSRYTNQASDEMEFSQLPGASQILAAALPRLAATAAAALLPNIRASSLRTSPLSPPLIVRYDAANGRNFMTDHGDFSLVTVNVALSSGHEGGGTWVQALGPDGGETIRIADIGHALLHSGPLWHAGAHTEKGVRYIGVVFLHSLSYVDHSIRLQARAINQLRDGNPSRAASLLNLAIEINPADAEHYVQLSTAWRRLGDRDRAAEAGRRAVAIGASNRDFNFDTNYNLACDCRELCDLEGAALAFAEAVRIGELSSHSFVVSAAKMGAAEVGLGGSLRRIGLLSEAQKALERAIEWEPDGAADAWAELGLVYVEKEDTESAQLCQLQVARRTLEASVRAPP